jgi:methylmalonyl-CoA/ethylmalonyl-CoA epimerase
VPRWQDVWNRYAVDLGAEWSSGGPAPGFAPAQLRFGNDARLEVLMPNAIEANDFLARFLAHSGPGPHHLTFKVPELSSALDQVRGCGFEPIGIDVRDPEWMEAFIHPKQATGVVVQIAEAPVPWTSPPPADYPQERRMRSVGGGPLPPASLRWVTHAVSDFGAATLLFVELLGGDVVGEGSSPGLQWMELAWAGPLRIRLVSPTGAPTRGPVSDWLAGRTGRIHHLLAEVEEPDGVAGARPIDPSLADSGVTPDREAMWEVGPADNFGLRLVLHGPR